METEDLIKLPAFGSSGSEREGGSGCKPSEGDSLPGNSDVIEDGENGRMHENKSNIEEEDNQRGALSGAKRSRTTVDNQQPSVHVIYTSLTRESRRKLEELLQQWSQWHVQHSSSSNDSNEVLESGEVMYFPALLIGLDKASAVSFWMDNQTKNPPNKGFMPLDGNSVPLYDRSYSLALTSSDGSSNLERRLEILDAFRCSHCGSYSHALKECPNARKKHKARQNQNARFHNPTRYCQNSPGGKFDDLRAGVLTAETRRLLGLGELDPPPWLNRMREIGPPLVYLGDDQPSGITIFADEERKEERGREILEACCTESSRKISVDFPGVNAPGPENAIRRRSEAESSTFNLSRGEILEAACTESPRKISVDFPRVNAPGPENVNRGHSEAESPGKISVDFPGVNGPGSENANRGRSEAESPRKISVDFLGVNAPGLENANRRCSEAESPRKISVDFPGVNAPGPENANRKRSEAESPQKISVDFPEVNVPGPKNANRRRSEANHPYLKYDNFSESTSRGHFYEQMQSRDYQDDGPPGHDLRSIQSWHYNEQMWSQDYHNNGLPDRDFRSGPSWRYYEQLWSRDFQQDGPPGRDLRLSPSWLYYEQMWSRDYQADRPPDYDLRLNPFLSSYSHRYGSGDFDFPSHSSGFGECLSDGGRRGPLTHYDYSNPVLYGL